MLQKGLQFLIAFWLLFVFGCTSAKKDLPNVIIVMTDDQGYGDISAHGNPHINTPNIDKLHSESIRLTNFHVGTTCAPSRAALMTGRDGNKVGVWHTIAGRSQLDRRETTMAEIFKENGYRTGMFGKWHLGDSKSFRPHDRGFEEALYHGGGGIWQGPDYWDNDYFDDVYFRNGTPEKKEGYCTDVWFDEAIKYMSKEDKKPFFTYITPNAPHFPYHIDSSYITPYLNDTSVVNPNFNGMITNIDENMGKLMNYLDQTGLSENTILIFMTDNGSSSGSELDRNGHVTKGYNAGMRGKKVSQYEGGHRVPCYIRWPKNNWVGGIDKDQLTAHIDLLPTIMKKIGFNSSKSLDLDGWDLSDILDNQVNTTKNYEERILIVDTQRRQFPLKAYRSSVMMGKWRLIDKVELYNVATDPGQKDNVINQYPEIRVKLSLGYEKWWDDIFSAFTNYTKAPIGGEEETILYAHDWIDAEMNGSPNILDNGSHQTPWNQTQIRKGLAINGTWTIDVTESGKYDIEMRRWPEELDLPITSGLPSKPAVNGGIKLPEGKSLNIIQADLKIDKKTIAAATVRANDKKIVFSLNLDQGTKKLQTTFKTEDGTEIGAYYVHIKKSA